MIHIIVAEDMYTLGKSVTFILQENTEYRFSINFTKEEINRIFLYTQYKTAKEAEMMEKQKNQILDDIINRVYEAFNITDRFISREDLRDRFVYEFYESIKKTTLGFTEQSEKEEKIPEEVREAMNLSQKAMDYGKKIDGMKKEVEEDKRNYYKKHGTFLEKSKAYLENVIN